MLVLEPIEWLGMVATRLDRSVTSDDSRISFRVAPTALSRINNANHSVSQGTTRARERRILNSKLRGIFAPQVRLFSNPVRYAKFIPVQCPFKQESHRVISAIHQRFTSKPLFLNLEDHYETQPTKFRHCLPGSIRSRTLRGTDRLARTINHSRFNCRNSARSITGCHSECHSKYSKHGYRIQRAPRFRYQRFL